MSKNKSPLQHGMLRIHEAAEIIGIHPNTLREACRHGNGPKHLEFSPRGKTVSRLFKREDVEAWVAEHTRGGK